MTDYDVIVIGSGAGGLTAAVALARAGKRVLVLEQHYVPGGYCHSFTLSGYRFSPGVHYLGQLQDGGALRGIYEGLGVAGDLPFVELNPDGFEHIVVGDLRFDIPKGVDRLEGRLIEAFPREARGIRRYLETLRRVSRGMEALGDHPSAAGMALLPFRHPTAVWWAWQSLGKLLDHTLESPVLKTILAAQCGDYALSPAQAPIPLHAGVTSHYHEGGYAPLGGGASIPRAFLRELRRHGGELRLSTRVARILVESRASGPRAVGVKLEDGTTLSAAEVVSNADPGVTFGRLVDPEHLPKKLRRRLERTPWSLGSVSLYLGVDRDPRELGLDSGNLWHYAIPDIDALYAAARRPGAPHAPHLAGLFVTATSLKDPTKAKRGHHTLEAFTFMGWECFAKWAKSSPDARPADYLALKAHLGERMIAAVERVVPGIRAHIQFSEVGTPLTNQFYAEATQGGCYGTEKLMSQLGPNAWGPATPVAGLTLCGASALVHGIMGATLSGLHAAGRILGARPRDLLAPGASRLSIYPAEDLAAWPDALQRRMAMRQAA